MVLNHKCFWSIMDFNVSNNYFLTQSFKRRVKEWMNQEINTIFCFLCWYKFNLAKSNFWILSNTIQNCTKKSNILRTIKSSTQTKYAHWTMMWFKPLRFEFGFEWWFESNRTFFSTRFEFINSAGIRVLDFAFANDYDLHTQLACSNHVAYLILVVLDLKNRVACPLNPCLKMWRISI